MQHSTLTFLFSSSSEECQDYIGSIEHLNIGNMYKTLPPDCLHNLKTFDEVSREHDAS